MTSSRIDDERQDAEHVLVRGRHRVRAEEALPHRVERAGADVAVDDTDRGQRKGKELAGTGAGGRQKASNQPTGLADGLEVGSPRPVSIAPTDWVPPPLVRGILGVRRNVFIH